MTDIRIHFFIKNFFIKEFRFAKLSIVYDKFSKIMDYRTFFETDLRKNGLLTQSLKKRGGLFLLTKKLPVAKPVVIKGVYEEKYFFLVI